MRKGGKLALFDPHLMRQVIILIDWVAMEHALNVVESSLVNQTWVTHTSWVYLKPVIVKENLDFHLCLSTSLKTEKIRLREREKIGDE